jgi:hypothetical protein
VAIFYRKKYKKMRKMRRKPLDGRMSLRQEVYLLQKKRHTLLVIIILFFGGFVNISAVLLGVFDKK